MKKEQWLSYIIPHPRTHQKAHLLSWHFLIIYILLFLLIRTGLDLLSIFQPGILGINSSVSVSQLVDATNQERQKKGLPTLEENSSLAMAAAAKAQNMFEENYWAHYSPSGKDPWSFILRSGYKFSYAGENLAKNFYTSEDVVAAWMNSPSHRDNILNSNYQEIGIAVVDGVLNGQQTTLVVQMFGKPYEPLAKAPQVDLGGKKIEISPVQVAESEPVFVAGVQKTAPLTKPLIDPFVAIRVAGMTIILIIGTLLLVDLVVLKRRGVFRLSSHHLAHLSFLAVAGASIYTAQIGEIL